MFKGTIAGEAFERQFVREFNSNKNNLDYKNYFRSLKIKKIDNYFLVQVSSNQYSKLSDKKVKTRADAYLITTHERQKINDILNENDYFLDEKILGNLEHKKVKYSGISIKRADSRNYQILKLHPNSFNELFNNFELGAAASLYTSRENELYKNDDVLNGWNTDFESMKKYFKNIDFIQKDLTTNRDLCQSLRTLANEIIEKTINSDKKLQEKIFNGLHLYEEPYSAIFFYQGEKIEKLNYIPFYITTGSGRSKGNYTLVLKPTNK